MKLLVLSPIHCVTQVGRFRVNIRIRNQNPGRIGVFQHVVNITDLRVESDIGSPENDAYATFMGFCLNSSCHLIGRGPHALQYQSGPRNRDILVGHRRQITIEVRVNSLTGLRMVTLG